MILQYAPALGLKGIQVRDESTRRRANEAVEPPFAARMRS